MNLLNNIKNPFILSSDFNLLKKINNNLNLKFDLGKVIVSVCDLSLDDVSLKIKNIENIDKFVDSIIETITDNVNVKRLKHKEICVKVINAWDKSPEKFVKQIKNGDVYDRVGLLTNNEYHHNLAIYFVKYNKFCHNASFTTGCGSDSHFGKDYYLTMLNTGIDKWCDEVIKDLNTKKIKDKFKNYINQTIIQIPLTKIDKFLSLSNDSIIKENKPKFPMDIYGDCLTSILSDENIEVDEELIFLIKLEHDVDISPLLNWEIEYSTDGFHNHDSQVCDYIVTFTSPEGHQYFTYDSHCLMTGWKFCDVEGPIKIE